MSRSPRRVLAAVLVTAVGAGVVAAFPASAHNPRNTPAGAPRMDLEVMVTPEIEGRITPGGTDPVVSVDGFGNRFVVARKEDAQTLVGVDQRARLAARAAPWSWTSSDDGLTWQNLDVLPRGAEQLLPQGVSRDVASAGPLTVLAENRGAAVVVQRVVAGGKGRITSAGTTVVATTLPGAVGADLALATNGRDAVVAVAGPAATNVTELGNADGLVTGSSGLPGSCDVAADPRPTARAFWAACTDGALHRSTDGGATFSKAGRFPAAQGRPQVDVGPDGTPYVLTGTTLVAVRGGRTTTQDLAVPRGEHSGTAFAVSNRGRVAVTTYTRSAPGEGWHVQVAMFRPGSRPVWYDFADHDPVTPLGAAAPPSESTSVDTDPLGRLQMVWASTFLQSDAPVTQLDRPLLRNVFAARSVTS
jgi:hypothetical protein